jgi:hypothetical protein
MTPRLVSQDAGPAYFRAQHANLSSVVDILGRFRLPHSVRERCQRGLLVSLLLHLQVCPHSVDGSSPDLVSIQRQNTMIHMLITCSGAQIVFRSFIQPVFSRYFSESGSTAADLRAKVESAGKSHAL